MKNQSSAQPTVKGVTVETLSKGDTLLVSVKKVANESYQAEFAEHIANPNSVPNALSALNKGDDRFAGGSSKPRRAWVKITPEAAQMIGIDISDIEEGEPKIFNYLNPMIDGQRLRVQVKESTEAELLAESVATTSSSRTNSIAYLLDNKRKTAKQVADRNTGEMKYFYKEGNLIFSETSIQFVAAHRFIDTKQNDAEGTGVYSFGECPTNIKSSVETPFN